MGSPYVMAVYTSAVASEFISASGKEFLPIGGFTGSIPEPTISQLEGMIRAGKFHLVASDRRPRSPPDLDRPPLSASRAGRRVGRSLHLSAG